MVSFLLGGYCALFDAKKHTFIFAYVRMPSVSGMVGLTIYIFYNRPPIEHLNYMLLIFIILSILCDNRVIKSISSKIEKFIK